MKNYLIPLTFFFLSVSVMGQEGEKKSRKEKKAERRELQIKQTNELLTSISYSFVPDQAIPMKGRAVNVDSFFLRVDGDDVNCYLPFYGRSHTAGYGGKDSPYNFTKKLEGYTVSKEKKKSIIKFSVRNDSDKIDFVLTVFETGSSSLSVTSPQRAHMSYNGAIGSIPKPKEKNNRKIKHKKTQANSLGFLLSFIFYDHLLMEQVLLLHP